MRYLVAKWSLHTHGTTLRQNTLVKTLKSAFSSSTLEFSTLVFSTLVFCTLVFLNYSTNMTSTSRDTCILRSMAPKRSLQTLYEHQASRLAQKAQKAQICVFKSDIFQLLHQVDIYGSESYCLCVIWFPSGHCIHGTNHGHHALLKELKSTC